MGGIEIGSGGWYLLMLLGGIVLGLVIAAVGRFLRGRR